MHSENMPITCLTRCEIAYIVFFCTKSLSLDTS